jgi:hypothetical protein
MKSTEIIKDERTRLIEDASYRIGFNIISFGVLLDIFIRSLLYPQESVWDLFALVVVSGFVATIYQARHKAIPPHFLRSMAILAVVSGVTAVVIVLVIAGLHW